MGESLADRRTAAVKDGGRTGGAQNHSHPPLAADAQAGKNSHKTYTLIQLTREMRGGTLAV